MIGGLNTRAWSLFGSALVHLAALAVIWWVSERLPMPNLLSNTLSVQLVTARSEVVDQIVAPVQTAKRLSPHQAASKIISTKKAKQLTQVVVEVKKINPSVQVASAMAAPMKSIPSLKVVEEVAQKPRSKPKLVGKTKAIAKTPTAMKQPVAKAIKQSVRKSNNISGDSNNSALQSTGYQLVDDIQPIDFDTANIKVKKMTRPKYPYYAILQRKSGTAVVAIELDKNGRVRTSKLHLSSAHKILDKAALHAARKWQFVPPVPLGEVLVPVRFELECLGNACKPKRVRQG